MLHYAAGGNKSKKANIRIKVKFKVTNSLISEDARPNENNRIYQHFAGGTKESNPCIQDLQHPRLCKDPVYNKCPRFATYMTRLVFSCT